MKIWLASNKEAHDFIPGQYWEDHYEMVREVLPRAEVYVYEDEAGIVRGFIGLDEDYIAGIFVCGEMRSRGIGHRLLDHAKAVKDRLTLKVYQKNERAVAFYQREGFQILCEETDEDVGTSEYKMEWVMENPGERKSGL